jgi:hypothetical protein
MKEVILHRRIMGIKCVCEECDDIFVSSEYQDICPRCRNRKIKKSKQCPEKGNGIAKYVFEIVVERRNLGGTTGKDLAKELRDRYGIKRNISGNAVSMLERAGYLVYLEGKKIYPYKNMHTGEIYEIETENR